MNKTISGFAPSVSNSRPRIDDVDHRANLSYLADLFILVGFALRIFRLDQPSLWYDELFSVYLARLDLVAITQHTAGDIHPPLYYYLLHFWTSAVGSSEFAVRYFSLFFGVLIMAVVYRFARKAIVPLIDGVQFDARKKEQQELGQASPGASSAAAAASGLIPILSIGLVAASPFHLWYSQESRMYTLAAFLGLLGTWFLLGMLDLLPAGNSGAPVSSDHEERVPAKQWLNWAGYVSCTAASLYLLYYSVFLFVFLNLFALVVLVGHRQGERHGRKADLGSKAGNGNAGSISVFTPIGHNRSGLFQWVSAQFVVLLLYLPWLPNAIRQAVSPPVPPWRQFVDLWSVLRDTWSTLSLGQSIDQASVWAYLILFFLIYLGGIGILGRRPWLATLIVGTVWAPLAIIFALSYWTPLFHVRYAFPYSPLFYLVLAAGLAVWFKRTPVFTIAIGLVLFGVQLSSATAYWFEPQYVRDDFRSAASFIDRHWRPGDAILLNAGYIYPAVTFYIKTPIDWRGRLTEYVAGPPSPGSGAIVVQTGSIDAPPTLGRGDPRADFFATNEAEVAAGLRTLAEHHQRLWLLRCYDTVTDPSGYIRDWLKSNAIQIEDVPFSGSSNLRVQGYILKGERQGGNPPPQAIDFGQEIQLTRHAIRQPSVTAGDSLDLDLAWQLSGNWRGDFRAFVALQDESGRRWQQQDEKPAGHLFPSSQWPENTDIPDPRRVEIPGGTPPGRYKLLLGVYDAETGRQFERQAGEAGKGLKATFELAGIEVLRPEHAAQAPPMQRQFSQPLGPLRLLGYNIGTYLLKPGERLGLELLWQAKVKPDRDLRPVLQLKDRNGKVWGEESSPMVEGRYSTRQWQADEMVRDPRGVSIAPDAPDGTYDLILTLERSETKLATVSLRGRQRVYSAPAKDFSLATVFGENMELVGFSLQNASGQSAFLDSARLEPRLATRPGEEITLTLVWRARGTIDKNLTVFAQLLDEANRIQGQRDQEPGRGEYPTTGWAAGEYIMDIYTIPLKPDFAGQGLRLFVGVYDPATGTREPATDASGRPQGDALSLATVTIDR